MKATPVTVLRSGGEYGPQHVRWLARQVPGLVCFSDRDIKGVPTVPLATDWPSWWAKLELFDPQFNGDLLHIDLDTVVIGDLDALLTVGRTTMLSDFYRPKLLASGLMYIAQQDKAAIFEAFSASPTYFMEKHKSFPLIGDQGFLNGRLQADRWQDILPGAVQSFKVHCQARPPAATAKVVCFHGHPRPWEIKRPWVPPLIGA